MHTHIYMKAEILEYKTPTLVCNTTLKLVVLDASILYEVAATDEGVILSTDDSQL